MRQVHGFHIGDVLRTSLAVYWQNLGPFLVLSLLAFAPAFVLLALVPASDPPIPPQLSAEPGELDPQAIREFWGEFFTFYRESLGYFLVSISGATWLEAALAYAVVRSLRTGPPSLLETVWQSLRALAHVCVVAVLVVLVTSLGFLLLVVPGIIATLMFFVAVPIAIVERRFGSALRRSHQLTSGYKWPLFGVLILLGIVFGVCGIVLDAITEDLAPNAGLYVGLLVSVATASGSAVVTAVCYHDLRVLKDGAGGAIADVFD